MHQHLMALNPKPGIDLGYNAKKVYSSVIVLVYGT